MPVSHLRVCPAPCNRIRWAPCSKPCHLPADTDPDSWRENMQAGAGMILPPRGQA